MGRATTGKLKMNLRGSTCLIMAICVHMIQGLSVHFKIPKPFYVALGKELVLKAVVEKIPVEKVFMVTWECNTNTGARRVATYPGNTQDPRIRMEKEGTTLRISDVQESDFGLYTITVTDGDGRQTFKEKQVIKTEMPPDATITLLCGVTGERAQWDSPVVTWFVDGVKQTNQTANISDGGRKLHLQEVKGHNFTCISDSSQGTSMAYFIIPDSTEPGSTEHTFPPCCTGLIVFGILFVIMLVGTLWFWLKNRQQRYVPPGGRN